MVARCLEAVYRFGRYMRTIIARDRNYCTGKKNGWTTLKELGEVNHYAKRGSSDLSGRNPPSLGSSNTSNHCSGVSFLLRMIACYQ